MVANDAGSRVTPTSVCFSEDGEVLTGLSARQMLARFPKSGVRAGNKAAIGKTTFILIHAIWGAPSFVIFCYVFLWEL